MGYLVAIIGRPNVGKSTLFNRLTGMRQAIVSEEAGTTRDRHYGTCIWNGRTFTVVDTGGYAGGKEDLFQEQIRRQVEIALEESNLVLFLVDTHEGIHDDDRLIADLIRKSGRHCLLIANKVDNPAHEVQTAEFYALGLGDPMSLAAASGSGTGEILDLITEQIPPEEEPEESSLPRIAIVGRPNVGKSSLLNALIGEERTIVTPIAGTTRDSINIHYNAYGFDFLLIDTAGLRKKSKVREDLEFYSVMRSVRAIENCDVCLLLIDAKEGFESQDQSIFFLAHKNNKGIVVVVNKWDLMEKETNTAKEYTKAILERCAPFKDVPVVFSSALTKQRIHKVLETAMQVVENRNRKIPTRELNDVMLPIVENNPPPSNKGKYVKIKFITQLPTHSPKFAFFCNLPQYVKEPYKRFLENQLREQFNFTGVPIEIFIRKK